MKQWEPGITLETLKLRAKLIQQVRHFFSCRGVLEVETPSLSQFPTLDLHLESFQATAGFSSQPSYLITSPEYHMKRLLAAGSGSIYQVCKAFRCDEAGPNHNPEFTILEWYRVGWSHLQLMKEIEALLDLLLKTGEAEYLTYYQAFQKYLSIDPLEITQDLFLGICREKEVVPPPDLTGEEVDRDEWLNYLLGVFIEPRLGEEQLLFLYEYPASQANLARLHPENPDYALRFEVYYKGIELGNGFNELTDAEQQERRFVEENRKRVSFGKRELPIDGHFLSALKDGMPDCSGVAMGLDRILMLATGKNCVDEVMSFSWKRS